MTITSRECHDSVHAMKVICTTEGHHGSGKHLGMYHGGYGEDSRPISRDEELALWKIAEEHDIDFPTHAIHVIKFYP